MYKKENNKERNDTRKIKINDNEGECATYERRKKKKKKRRL